MVKLERFVDKFFGSVLVAAIVSISKLFPKRFPKDIRRILVIKLWALGDSVVLLPTIEGLRKSFPAAQIDVLVRKRNISVFIGNKDVNNILLFEPSKIFSLITKFKKYNVVIDTEPYLNISALIATYLGKFRIGFSHGIRSMLYQNKILFSKKQHMVQNYLDMLRSLGIAYNTDKLVKLHYTEDDEKVVENLIKKNGIKKTDFIVGISPGVAESVKARMWPIENVSKLIDLLVERLNAKIIVSDSKDNRYLFNEISTMVKAKNRKSIVDAVGLGIKQFFCLVEKCDVFISNDTGPMHIAAAQGVKTLGLFGPNTPVLWAPYGKGNMSIYKPCSTGPFIDNARGHMPDKLTPEQANCMRQIKVEEVFNAVKKLRW